MSLAPKKQKVLTPAQRRQILNRLEKGEAMASLGRAFGVTRSAIYELQKRFREKGEIVIEGSPFRGRSPNPKLNRTHEKYLRELFAGPQFPPTDPSLIDVGNATKAQVAIEKKFGFQPSAEECSRVLSKFNTQHLLLPSRFVEYKEPFPDTFLAWQKSNVAKELNRREKSYLQKRAKIDIPSQPGNFPIADRPWLTILRCFHMDDPLLYRSQDLSRILEKIVSKKSR